jgi:low affinity Fe/Cu permease
MKKSSQTTSGFLENLSAHVTRATGSNAGFLIAFSLIVIWATLGPLFDFSDTWKWIISIGTSMITFLMVFLLQKSQNKDSIAIQLKLNELVAAHELASNRLINVEGMTEDELKVIQKYYSKLRKFTEKEEKMQQSHSIDESHERHDIKKEMEEALKKGSNKE